MFRWLLLGVCGFMYFAGLLMITEGKIQFEFIIDHVKNTNCFNNRLYPVLLSFKDTH